MRRAIFKSETPIYKLAETYFWRLILKWILCFQIPLGFEPKTTPLGSYPRLMLSRLNLSLLHNVIYEERCLQVGHIFEIDWIQYIFKKPEQISMSSTHFILGQKACRLWRPHFNDRLRNTHVPLLLRLRFELDASARRIHLLYYDFGMNSANNFLNFLIFALEQRNLTIHRVEADLLHHEFSLSCCM